MSKQYLKDNPDITCVVTGMRQSEGGQRSGALKTNGCYFKNANGQYFYHPLSLWTDEIKLHYKETRSIVYSDCYEV